MEKLTNICPKCGSSKTCLNGHSRGKPRRKCQSCGYQYTQNKLHRLTRNTICKVCGPTNQRVVKGLCLSLYRKWMKYKKNNPDITPEEAAKLDLRYKHAKKNPSETR